MSLIGELGQDNLPNAAFSQPCGDTYDRSPPHCDRRFQMGSRTNTGIWRDVFFS